MRGKDGRRQLSEKGCRKKETARRAQSRFGMVIVKISDIAAAIISAPNIIRFRYIAILNDFLSLPAL